MDKHLGRFVFNLKTLLIVASLLSFIVWFVWLLLYDLRKKTPRGSFTYRVIYRCADILGLHPNAGSYSSTTIGCIRIFISTSQKQFKNGVVKDRDKDGIGEYGYFVELSGTAPVPVGTSKGSIAKPAFITSVFGATSSTSAGISSTSAGISSTSAGIANKSGYNFRMYLPSGNGSFIGEDGKPSPPASSIPPPKEEADEINAQEERWCVYAWPTSAGNSGKKAFFVDQSGEVMATNNIRSGSTAFVYSGNNDAGTRENPKALDIYDEKMRIITGKPAAHGLIWNSTTNPVEQRKKRIMELIIATIFLATIGLIYLVRKKKRNRHKK